MPPRPPQLIFDLPSSIAEEVVAMAADYRLPEGAHVRSPLLCAGDLTLSECTELPAFSDALRTATSLPVFDVVTCLDFSLIRKPVTVLVIPELKFGEKLI